MDMKHLLELFKEPGPFSSSTDPFWNDPHISKYLLQAHLDPEVNEASRKDSTIQSSLQWLKQEILPSPPAPILDLGCGPGQYSNPLARLGYEVTGVDLSSRSLEYAREYAVKENLSVEYHHMDYMGISFQEEFQVVLLIFCDFGVFSLERRTHLLKRIYKALRPGGFFLFDVFTPQNRVNEERTSSWSLSYEGFWSQRPHLLLTKCFHYPEQDLYLDQYVVIEGEGEKEEEEEIKVYRFWEQQYTPESIERLLKDTGFHMRDYYSTMIGEKYHEGAETLTVIAEKT